MMVVMVVVSCDRHTAPLSPRHSLDASHLRDAGRSHVRFADCGLFDEASCLPPLLGR